MYFQQEMFLLHRENNIKTQNFVREMHNLWTLGSAMYHTEWSRNIAAWKSSDWVGQCTHRDSVTAMHLLNTTQLQLWQHLSVFLCETLAAIWHFFRLGSAIRVMPGTFGRWCACGAQGTWLFMYSFKSSVANLKMKFLHEIFSFVRVLYKTKVLI